MDINRDTLKEYFERGDRPTEDQFIDLIDSQINKEDDQVFVDGSKLHNNAQIGLGAHRDPNDPPTTDLGLVRLYVDQRVSVNQLKVRGGAPGVGKLLFAKDNSGNVEWRDQNQLDQNHWMRSDMTSLNSAMYSVPTGNIGIGTTNPQAKLHVFGTTKTTQLNIEGPVATGDPEGKVLTIDAQGNVKAVAVGDLHTAGYDLWYKDPWNLHSKVGFGVCVDKGLYVEEKIIVKSGIVTTRLATDPGPQIPNDLNDLGLYSFRQWYWNRYVTNNGAHRFYVDLAKGLDTSGPSGVLEVIPKGKNNLFRPTSPGNFEHFQNDTVQINADVMVGGWRPFLFRTYQLVPDGPTNEGGDPTFRKDTGISKEEYPGALIGGFRNSGMAFLHENNQGWNFIHFQWNDNNPNWVVEANFANATNKWSSEDENSWFVDVMFVRRELADAHWSYSKHWEHSPNHPTGPHPA